MYYIIDCLSFVINGEMLCVFDLYVWYVFDVILEFFGCWFDLFDEEFWNNFVDVWFGYLEEFFELKNFIMFCFFIRMDVIVKEF